jgi:hypothetical protein
MILLPDKVFLHAVDIDIKNKILNHQEKDDLFTNALKAIKEEGPLPIRSKIEDWIFDDQLLFFQGRCFIPDDEDLKREIVKLYHDSPGQGHPGQHGTHAAVRKDYWWPGMAVFIKNYVKGCASCQQNKIDRKPTVAPLKPIRTNTTRPFGFVTIDFHSGLPESNGYNSIMVVVDHGTTKGVILIPCTTEIDSLETANAYISHVYKRYGLPEDVITDRGTQFTSEFFKQLGKLLNINLRRSTAYHPQTDGETERKNQEIDACLRIICTNNPEDWAEKLPIIEFALNNRENSVTKQTPFYLMNGVEPISIPIPYPKTNLPAVEEWITLRQEARDEANAAHELARMHMASRITRDFTPFEKGDKVWIDTKNIRFEGSQKFKPKKTGPFEITDVLDKLTYRIKLPKTWKIHNVFHATLLSRYSETTAHGPNFPRPPPEILNEEEVYEIERIVNHRKRYGNIQYLVKWKGYPDSDNSWEPERNLTGAKEELDAYKRRKNLSIHLLELHVIDEPTTTFTEQLITRHWAQSPNGEEEQQSYTTGTAENDAQSERSKTTTGHDDNRERDD